MGHLTQGSQVHPFPLLQDKVFPGVFRAEIGQVKKNGARGVASGTNTGDPDPEIVGIRPRRPPEFFGIGIAIAHGQVCIRSVGQMHALKTKGLFRGDLDVSKVKGHGEIARTAIPSSGYGTILVGETPRKGILMVGTGKTVPAAPLGIVTVVEGHSTAAEKTTLIGTVPHPRCGKDHILKMNGRLSQQAAAHHHK